MTDQSSDQLSDARTRGGSVICMEGGARKYYQPVKVRKVGPDGEVIRITQKKAYYQCDLGQRGGGLRQPRISFMTRDSDDNAVGYLGCSNTSVGQYLGISRDEQGKETLDEN